MRCSHYAEHAARGKTLPSRVVAIATTGGRASDFKKVCTLVHRADEREDGCRRGHVAVAQERDDCRLVVRSLVIARGAVRVVHDKLTTAKERIGRLLPILCQSESPRGDCATYPIEYVLPFIW